MSDGSKKVFKAEDLGSDEKNKDRRPDLQPGGAKYAATSSPEEARNFESSDKASPYAQPTKLFGESPASSTPRKNTPGIPETAVRLHPSTPTKGKAGLPAVVHDHIKEKYAESITKVAVRGGQGCNVIGKYKNNLKWDELKKWVPPGFTQEEFNTAVPGQRFAMKYVPMKESDEPQNYGPPQESDDLKFADRNKILQREYEVMKTLKHRNVCRAHFFEEVSSRKEGEVTPKTPRGSPLRFNLCSLR